LVTPIQFKIPTFIISLAKPSNTADTVASLQDQGGDKTELHRDLLSFQNQNLAKRNAGWGAKSHNLLLK